MPVRNHIAAQLAFVAVGTIVLSSIGCRSMSAFPGMSWLDNGDNDARYASVDLPEVEFQALPPPGSTAEPYAVNGSTAAADVTPASFEAQTYPTTPTPFGPEVGRQSGYADNSYAPPPAVNSPVNQEGAVAGNPQQGFYSPEYSSPSENRPTNSTYSPPDAGVGRTALVPSNATPRYDGTYQGSATSAAQPMDSPYGGNSSNEGQFSGGPQGGSFPAQNLAPATPIPEISGGYTPVTPVPDYNSHSQTAPATTTYPNTNAVPVTPTIPGATGPRQPVPPFRPAGATDYGGLDSVPPSSMHQGPQPTHPVIPAGFESNSSSGESWEASPQPTKPVAEPSVYQTGDSPAPFSEIESSLSLA